MPNLTLENREITGKAVKRLRVEGKIPATLYARGKESQNVMMDRREFDKIFKDAGFSTLIDAKLEGSKGLKLLLKEVQIHPTNDAYLSASFYATDAKTEISADVPVVTIGTSPAEDLGLGFIVQQVDAITVVCLPDRLPQHIEIDLSGLNEAGQVITIADITLPEGVELHSSMELTTAIVYVSADQKVNEADLTDAVEGEGAEGEAGEDAAEGETAADAAE